MAVNSETEINLKTLRRVDSNIVEIIDTASQVAIYKYERKLNKWEGTDVEGTLFLYKRSLYPFHGFIIVNRMSTTNFIEAITSDMEFVQHEPYFLYRKSCGEIIGSWFYEKRDFRRITNKIQSIVLKQTTPPRRQRCSSDSDSQLKKDDDVQDIMSMLSEAHTEYVKIETRKLNPKKNFKEDVNDLNNYVDKKINNKSLRACSNKSKSPCMRSSSEEKYPVSPRRRYLSTGSYDSAPSLPLPSKDIIYELESQSKDSIENSNFGKHPFIEKSLPPKHIQLIPGMQKNMGAISNSTNLSPLFSCDEISLPSMSGINILDQSVDSIKGMLKPQPQNVVLPNVLQMSASNKSDSAQDMRNKEVQDMHSSLIKGALVSQIEVGSDILLKIHEAYIASLKSVFTPKK